ncbi:MAG: hypothetical protein ACTSW8_04970 [Candidatus Thorarchaeota archaeon]
MVLINTLTEYIVSGVIAKSEGAEFLVKECPCFREFEGEQICINDNVLRKMVTIDVDTELIGSKLVSEEFLRTKSNEDDLCFCLVYLGEDELYHCMSQQQNILVRGQEVSKEEMQQALEILAPENARFATVLCEECLYNIIAALKDEGYQSCPI